MMGITNIIKSVKTLHTSIAQDVWPNGALLKCLICGKEIEATTEMCADYLAHGWPKCHEKTMRMEKTEVG